MRIVVLALVAGLALGGCMYIKVDDTGDDRGGRPTDCSKPDADGCRPE